MVHGSRAVKSTFTVVVFIMSSFKQTARLWRGRIKVQLVSLASILLTASSSWHIAVPLKPTTSSSLFNWYRTNCLFYVVLFQTVTWKDENSMRNVHIKPELLNKHTEEEEMCSAWDSSSPGQPGSTRPKERPRTGAPFLPLSKHFPSSSSSSSSALTVFCCCCPRWGRHPCFRNYSFKDRTVGIYFETECESSWWL